MATMLFQGHGSYRFTLDDDTVIYVDPYFGKEYELEADLILVTHDHFDHDLSLPTRNTPPPLH